MTNLRQYGDCTETMKKIVVPNLVKVRDFLKFEWMQIVSRNPSMLNEVKTEKY